MILILLKESILLQSEILDLKASYSDDARGVVIESKIDKGKGPVSTILVSNRTGMLLEFCEASDKTAYIPHSSRIQSQHYISNSIFGMPFGDGEEKEQEDSLGSRFNKKRICFLVGKLKR